MEKPILPAPTLSNAALFAGARIGLLGGSFNPAHVAHLETSLYALQALRLDAVWWLVSPQNPLKNTESMGAFTDRLAGARHFLAAEPRIQATDLELHLGTRYTADSLAALQAAFSETRFVWLMGADNLIQISRWQDWRSIFERVPIAVLRRPGYDGAETSEAAQFFRAARRPPDEAAALADRKTPAWVLLDNPGNPLSASLLRATEDLTKL